MDAVCYHHIIIIVLLTVVWRDRPRNLSIADNEDRHMFTSSSAPLWIAFLGHPQ